MKSLENFECNSIEIQRGHCASIEKILIIEDFLPLQKSIQKNLTDSFDIICDVASTEEEAVELLSANSYDLIIIDLHLPDSSGNFIGYLIRNNNRIFVITASENLQERFRLVSLPIVDYLYKTDEKSIINYLITSIKRLIANQHTLVAICDDSQLARRQVREILATQNLEIIEFSDGSQAYECIINQGLKVDLLITDINMPQMNGIDLIRHIRHQYNSNELPILAFSSSDKRQFIAQILKTGANDFVAKPFCNEEFLTRLNATLNQSRLYDENTLLIENLQKIATNDFLTQLYNRNYFYSTIKHVQAQAIREKFMYGIIMLDVDKFKGINDYYGHQAGDTALKMVADILKKTARESDILCRWGGEEFLILVPKTTIEEVAILAERIRIMIEAHPVVIKPIILEFSLTASFGIAIGMSENVDSIIKQADDRLYIAKQSGRNRVVYE